MKCIYDIAMCITTTSPSMRREWIEMINCLKWFGVKWSPSMRREWIEISHISEIFWTMSRLPPCGGSGLKFQTALTRY